MERILGAHGMINYVDARTAWMDDIVKQAQWQGIAQVGVLPAVHRQYSMALLSIQGPTMHQMWLPEAKLAADHGARARAIAVTRDSHRSCGEMLLRHITCSQPSA